MSEPTWELLGGGGVVGGPIDYVGDWAAGTTYQPGQVARYAGVDYLAVNPSIGQVPPLASPYPHAEVCIYDSTLAAAAPMFDVQNISQAYKHLRLVMLLRCDWPASSNVFVDVRFNGDATGANYFAQNFSASGAAATAGDASSVGAARCGTVPAVNAPAGTASVITVDIPYYTDAVFHKALHSIVGNASFAAASEEVRLFSARWASAAAINRIQVAPQSFTNNFLAGSRLMIYGVLALGQAPPVTTLAPGGIGTSLPGSPANGEAFTLVDSLTAPTYAWKFRYVASITDAYKWVFEGGFPLFVEVATNEAISATTYAALATAGPSITLPRAGIYEVTVGMRTRPPAAVSAITYMSYDIGATAAVDADAVQAMINDAGTPRPEMSLMRSRVKTISAAGALVAKYRVTSSSAAAQDRFIEALPLRVA